MYVAGTKRKFTLTSHNKKQQRMQTSIRKLCVDVGSGSMGLVDTKSCMSYPTGKNYLNNLNICTSMGLPERAKVRDCPYAASTLSVAMLVL